MFEIISILIAFLALSVSICSLVYSRRQSTSEALLVCLEQHLQIARLRQQAINEKSRHIAELFYRETLDLLWTEHQLIRAKLIPDYVMWAWLHRKHCYYRDDHHIRFESDKGELIEISYKKTWDGLKNRRYFDPKDNFVQFMELVHEGDINHALKIKAGHAKNGKRVRNFWRRI